MHVHKVHTWQQSINNIFRGIFGLCRKEKQSRASTAFRFTGTGEAVSSVGNKTSEMDNFYLLVSAYLTGNIGRVCVDLVDFPLLYYDHSGTHFLAKQHPAAPYRADG